MSVEGEACPLCGEVEGKPQGGASSFSAATNTHTCDAKPHAVKTHPLHAEAEKESREDWSRPSCSHTFDLSATDTCNVDNDGEGCCTPREDGSIGESHQKTQTMHSNCSSDSGIPTPSCRICFQGAEQGDLLNPCRCDGSVRYTHQQCLLKWISERGYWTCELCCYHFHVIAIRLKKPTQWQAISLNLVEKVQILAVFLGSVFLVASISWLLWSALSPNAVWQRRDVLFQICYGMYAFMDIVCMGLICHEGAAVLSVFLRWRAVNLEWDVQNYDKASDMADISSGPRALWLPQSTVGPDGPSMRHPSRAWSGLSLCCPLPGPTASLEHARESGEVVVRVTTV